MNIGKRNFTDFDAVMEWRDLGWLVFEVKHGDKGVPIGQRIALERFVKDAGAFGKYAVAAVAEHNVSNPREDIYLRDCMVRSLYCSNECVWRPPKRVMSAHELMIGFISVLDSSFVGDGPYGPSFFYRG